MAAPSAGLFLCVDCGGSKTSAVVCNAQGTILGRALGGPSNFAYLGLETFLSSVTIAVSNALKTCLSPPSIDPVSLPPPSDKITFSHAWFGVSGVDSPAAAASITPRLSALLGIPEGPRLIVANDTHLLAAPVRLHPDIQHAVAVIAGTGSIGVSFALSPSGQLEELGRVGGWGWMLGDEGGGASVGREAVRQVLQAWELARLEDREDESMLSTELLKLYKINEAPEILTLIHYADPPVGALAPAEDADVSPHLTQVREKRLSSLSPLVFKCAFEHDDPLALSILRTVADQLAAQLAVLLAQAPSSSAGESDKPPGKRVVASKAVISFGGSIAMIDSYRKLILDALETRGHVFKYIELVDDAAAVGAAGLAMAGVNSEST